MLGVEWIEEATPSLPVHERGCRTPVAKVDRRFSRPRRVRGHQQRHASVGIVAHLGHTFSRNLRCRLAIG